MKSFITKSDSSQPVAETAVYLFDDWFDPIEAGVRDRVRGFIQAMIEGELDETLMRPRYGRRAASSSGKNDGLAAVAGRRHGHRSRSSGGLREGRVLSRNRPSTPACMKRSCQRQTTDLLLPVRRMISAVPKPSAVSRTIRARQTCFCGLFRLAAIAASRPRSAALTFTTIPLRIPQTRTPASPREGIVTLVSFTCQ